MYLYQRPEFLSLTTRSVTIGPGILPVRPQAIDHPRHMPSDPLLSEEGEYLDDMLWDLVIGRLSNRDRAICAATAKRWRSAVLRVTCFLYHIYESSPSHGPSDSPTFTLSWKLTAPILRNSVFGITSAAAAVAAAAAATCTLDIILRTMSKSEPYWQQNRTISEIDRALDSVVENARSHKAFHTLILETDPITMPILLQHIPPTICISIKSLHVSCFLHCRTATAQAGPCFKGLVFRNLESLDVEGVVSGFEDIPVACPQLLHLTLSDGERGGLLKHLRNLPHLETLDTWGSKMSDVEGFTRLTRLSMSDWLCSETMLHSSRAVLPTLTHLHTLTLTNTQLMTSSEALSLQLALDFIAPRLCGLRILSLTLALPVLVILNAFTALQCVKMTTQMQLAASADTPALKRLIMTTEAGELVPTAAYAAAEALAIAAGASLAAAAAAGAAVIDVVTSPFPTSCTHIRAPMHKLRAAVACASVRHLVVDPMFCTDAYMEQLLGSVTAGAWPDAEEVLLEGEMAYKGPDLQNAVFDQLKTVPYQGNVLLLDAIASRQGISTLQRVCISAMFYQPTLAADEVVDILCRITSLKRVRICRYYVRPAHLLQLAAQQNMEVIEVLDCIMDEAGQAGCDVAQALAGELVKIQWVESERVMDDCTWGLEG